MLIYLTSKEYPGRTADHNFVRNMARAFTRIMGRDFLLVVAGGGEVELKGINYLNLELKAKRGRALFYFGWILKFVFEKRKEKITFFSNDSYLLLILIFWRIMILFMG